MNKELFEEISNTIRGLTLDAIGKANSGHVGLPLGCADVVALLYTQVLKHYPKEPNWINRDRFILSAGHGSMLLYAILHLTGYAISIDDIKNFRQLHSITPGHPEYGITPGIEVTTGPLGQGVSNAVGMAIAENMLSEKFNKLNIKIIDHHTFCLAGDGCLMEGISSESVSLAGHLGLGKLVLIYDNNKITIDGNTNISFTEDIGKRFESYNWHVQDVNGYDYDAFLNAIYKAKEIQNKPSIIITNTIPGKGLVNYEGSYKSHGCPMNSKDIEISKKNMGISGDFIVTDNVKNYFDTKFKDFKSKYHEWEQIYNEYKSKYPTLEKELNLSLNASIDLVSENFIKPEFLKPMATRNSSGKILNEIAKKVSFLVGGSADLAGSNKTTIDNSDFITKGNFKGKNIHFGVREHAMGGILNGITLHKGFKAYGGTFLVFSDYMRPSIRLAALMNLPVTYIFTHDSFQVGEDGPTHQPIEQIQSLRNIPNLTVIRPCDVYEVEAAWKYILKNNKGPVSLILTRQTVKAIDRKMFSSAEGLFRGGYILKDTDVLADLIIISSGSEVSLSIKLTEIIEKKCNKKIKIVSMPSMEIFDKQAKDYKEKVLPKLVKNKVSIEFGLTEGWRKYVGLEGLTIGINQFGASAPANVLVDYYNLSPEKISEQIIKYFDIF